MKLVIVLSVAVVAFAAPEGYHYDSPPVSSTLYFPSVPSYAPEVDDCVEPEAPGKVELPIFSQLQHSSPVYQTPVVQPLKTQVIYEKPAQQPQEAWKAQEQQTSAWGSSGSGHLQQQQQQQFSSWGSSGSSHQQQASLWGSSSAQQSLGSASWSSDKKEQTANVWAKPQHTVEEVFKHVYVHVPPEDKEEYEAPRVIQPVSHKQKHYKIIFIKAPSPPAPKSVVVPPQPSNEEKTIVYVLHQKPEQQQEIIVQKPEPAKQNKPEVYFIKYKNRKEEQKQHTYVTPVVSSKSANFVDSGSAGYSSGSYVSSTAAPLSYSTAGSKNTGASYSYVSSTPAPVVYSTPQVVEYAETGSNGYSGSSSSSGDSTGSSYSSFTSGTGAGYESYVDLGNSGYSSFSNAGSLGIINVDSGSDYHFVPSTTVAPVVKVTTPVVSYVSSTPRSVVSSTIGEISIKNTGLSGYSSRTSGGYSQAGTTTAAPTKKICRRCASTTSSTLKVQDAYASNVY